MPWDRPWAVGGDVGGCWFLSLHPDAPDHVNILYGGGLAPEFVDDPEADTHFQAFKALLNEVNEEDRTCTESVFRGLFSRTAEPGPLAHLERPNYEFAQYLNSKLQDVG